MKGIIIFDFDSVLVDSTKVLFDIFNRLYKNRALAPLNEDEFRDLYEGDIWEGHRRHLPRTSTIEEFKKEFKTLFSKQREETFFSRGFAIALRLCMRTTR